MMNNRSLSMQLKESCKSSSDLFYSSIKDVENTQKRKLIELLSKNKDTEFGRKNEYEKIKTVEDFRNNVPISRYDDYEEYIIQIADGVDNVLTHDKVLMLEPTSGSTSPTKFIPYTKTLKEEFQNGIFPWLYDLLNNCPGLIDGCFYWSITPATIRNEVTSGGVPIGFGDDSSYFTEYQQKLISRLSAVPFDVAQIRDIDKFKEKTLSYLSSRQDLSFISVWNPTYLTMLLKPINNPGEVWPNISLISAWADGNAANYIGEVGRLFPNALVQGKGLIATEGFISFPLIGLESSVLSINSHFYEFRNLDDDKDIRLAHELTKDEEYEVILTTGGGLYRYNLEDIVKVTGFLDECPFIKFMGRNNNISDLFGEKLNEYHAAKSISETFKEFNLSPLFFLLAPEVSNKTSANYTLFVETKEQIDKKKLTEDLDERLRENFHYDYCRKLGQLEPMELFLIDYKDKSATEVFLEEYQKKGKKIGNVKPSILSSQIGWSNIFNGYS